METVIIDNLSENERDKVYKFAENLKKNRISAWRSKVDEYRTRGDSLYVETYRGYDSAEALMHTYLVDIAENRYLKDQLIQLIILCEDEAKYSATTKIMHPDEDSAYELMTWYGSAGSDRNIAWMRLGNRAASWLEHLTDDTVSSN